MNVQIGASARGIAWAVAVAVVAGLAAGPRAVSAQGTVPATPMQTRGQRLAADGAIRVWNLVGAVRVTGWARDSIAVTARTAPGGQFFFGGGDRGVKVGVEARDGSSVPAVLELRVPHRARVWIKTATAPVMTTGLTGDVEVYSVSGEVRIDGRPATLRVESLDGPVTVNDGATWVRARTSSGTIRVRGPVDDASLTTVGGAVRLDGAVAQRARVETVTGAVRYAGAVASGAEVAIDTHAGDVALAVTPPAGVRPVAAGPPAAAFDLLTLNGRITAPRSPALRAAVRPRGSGQAAAVAGADGAGRVEVRSFRGTITVDDRR